MKSPTKFPTRSLVRLTALCLTPALLVACTGTEEPQVALRVALLTDGGATLRTVTPNADSSSAPVNADKTVPVIGGVTLNSLPSGQRLALTLKTGIESRSSDLADPQPFVTPPFTPVCLIQTASSAARDRLLTLSQCDNGPQQLALYSAGGTLIWTAPLPTFLPPAPGTDVPPVRLAVSGDVGVVARPRLGGGSEVLRAALQNVGDTVAVVSDPLPTPAIRDLVAYNAGLLAATDTGVQKLSATGLPDGAALAAFGARRFDRLWSGTAGSQNLLAAWRSSVLSNQNAQPLLIWDGNASRAASTVASVADLRDITLAPDGNLYTLTATSLTRYNTALGLQSGNFTPRVLLTGLNDARAVIWLVPAAVPAAN
ncbi:hypothetical protein [Deinococcus sp. AJ005]|uniref:hypothetical protein n=1 Tax=Deinococcus sp. AJ005 TaxID=2652443 RepID=UPI00125CBF33|nr:hypothetical protein [Deinococcus sp. AJ005]QFP76008.1 hypothetical protein DAAJ005_05725 [Deinococcus sp. AJ005]